MSSSDIGLVHMDLVEPLDSNIDCEVSAGGWACGSVSMSISKSVASLTLFIEEDDLTHGGVRNQMEWLRVASNLCHYRSSIISVEVKA